MALHRKIANFTGLALLAFSTGIVNAGIVLGENPSRSRLTDITPSPEALAPLRQGFAARFALETYRLRVVYLIPSNRVAPPRAEDILRNYVLRTVAWFEEHMERLGKGRKTLAHEVEVDGVTPKVNLAWSARPDHAFHDFNYGTRWGKILNGIAEAGFPPWQHGELLLVIAETQVQLPDGSYLRSSIFFGGAGGDFTGVGVVTGETLARMAPGYLRDDRHYDGLTIDRLGPYPLRQNLSFPWFEGTTLSSVSSSGQGGAVHEVGHGLGLWHDHRNDENFDGNLMGNGLRGFRGALYPRAYPTNAMRLATASALMVDYSRFFNGGRTNLEDSRPAVWSIQPTYVPIDGKVGLEFYAADDTALAGAILVRDGHNVADMPLQGTWVHKTIVAPDYKAGVTDEWRLIVLDTEGNRTVSGPVIFAPASLGHNQAAIPNIRVDRTRLMRGETVLLDASRSVDPGGSSAAVKVEWDLDGDGNYDTPASTAKTRAARYDEPGVYALSAKLTDEDGAVSYSMPIGLRVDPSAVNDPVSMEATVPRDAFARDLGACPDGFSGQFRFMSALTNASANTISGPMIDIRRLTGGNYLASRGALFREGERYAIPWLSGLVDGKLEPGETVDVTFTVCLRVRKRFNLSVDVLGAMDSPN